jgi:hypothetical protein
VNSGIAAAGGGTATGPTGGGWTAGGTAGCGRGREAGRGGAVVQAAITATMVNKAGTLRRVESMGKP